AITSTSFSGARPSSSMSETSMPANCSKSTALPSMTGFDASAASAPNPGTRGPVVTTPARLARAVERQAASGSAARASRASAAPGERVGRDLFGGERDARRIREGEVVLVRELLAWNDRGLSRNGKFVVCEGGFPQAFAGRTRHRGFVTHASEN